MATDDKADPRPDFTPSDKEGLFNQVRRESQERRAQADRRSAARRAAELQEIAKQVAARKSHPNTKPVASVSANVPDDEDSGESMKDHPA